MKILQALNLIYHFFTELNPCLPVRVLLRPLKKRFAFHFMGSRQTARIDRPEWFLTQTLTWIKDHQNFVQNNVQPVADKLELDNVNAVVCLFFYPTKIYCSLYTSVAINKVRLGIKKINIEISSTLTLLKFFICSFGIILPKIEYFSKFYSA